MEFTVEQLKVLSKGLVTLEATFDALEQRPPASITDLKSVLARQERAISSNTNACWTTEQVAVFLDCSLRQVSYLAKQQKIKLVQRGKRGRGKVSLYDAKSVKKHQKRIIDPKREHTDTKHD
jgi:hypothetical protein